MIEKLEALNLNYVIVEAANNFPQVAWATAFAYMLMSPTIVAGNGLVLPSVLLNSFKNLKSVSSRYIIFNLALADLLVGVLTHPLLAGFYVYLINNRELLY